MSISDVLFVIIFVFLVFIIVGICTYLCDKTSTEVEIKLPMKSSDTICYYCKHLGEACWDSCIDYGDFEGIEIVEVKDD